MRFMLNIESFLTEYALPRSPLEEYRELKAPHSRQHYTPPASSRLGKQSKTEVVNYFSSRIRSSVWQPAYSGVATLPSTVMQT